MRVTVLGCGGSGGVPQVGNHWGACDPENPKNRRRRASILVEENGRTLLVDTSPDLREQLLDAGIDRLDAVIYTHGHADHLHGIDDLRGLNRIMQRPIPIYADRRTLETIRTRFGYVFAPIAAGEGYYKPTLEPREITGEFVVAGLRVTPFEQDHGFSKTLGFRFGRFAYSTDVAELDDAAFAALAGVEIWIVDCLRDEPHPTHSHLTKTLAWIERVGCRRAILTHMDPGFDYERLRQALPDPVEPGFDGLVIDL
jgi:phosphoribosyl 1,2-cyclic phosphate phosphodiesterase